MIILPTRTLRMIMVRMMWRMMMLQKMRRMTMLRMMTSRVKMWRMMMLQEEEDHDVEDDDVEVENGSEDRGPHLRSQNALGHSPRAFLCENLQGKCSAPDGKCRASGGSRDHDPHFVRACAIEMHMDMSEEPTCAGIYKNKIPRPRCILRPRPALSTSLRRRNAHGRVTRAILRGNLQGKSRALGARHLFCASLRSRHMDM